jgi:Cof subfamily protein (haloacid dehalogenase superfamily)
MPRYDLLALDLDDTLLRKDLSISPRCLEAVRRCRAAGVRVTLSSGRMLRSVEPFAAKLGLEVAVISYNGALIAELPSRRVMAHHPVPAAEAEQVIDELRRARLHVNVYVDDQLYVEQLTDEARAYCARNGVEPVERPFHELPAARMTKVLAIGPPHELTRLAPIFAASHPGLHVTKSRPEYLEFMPAGINKGLGLADVAGFYGIERQRVAAVGDGPNDVEMLEYAGLGVAVANAPARVRAAADMVAPSNEEDGVAWVIDNVVL